MDIIKFENPGYKFQVKNQTQAEIQIYTFIGEDYFDTGMSAVKFSEELSLIPETVNTLDIRLNSPGGDVFDGVAIYNQIRSFARKTGANVRMFVDGWAASIASIIMMAGDEIIMGEGTTVMIHKPWTMTVGDASEHEDTIMRLDKIEDNMIDIYRRKSNASREEFEKMLKAETWLNAEEAIALNLVDRKTNDDESFAAAASVDLGIFAAKAKWFSKKPNVQSKSEVYRKQANKIFDKLKV